MQPVERRLRPSRRRGAMAVEFALCLWLGLIPVVFAIIDWSWYLFQAMTVQSMFHRAAQVGGAVDMSLGTCPGDQAEATLGDALSAWNLTGATLSSSVQTYTFGVGGTTDIQELTLTVSLPFAPLIGLFSLVPDTIAYSITVPLEDQRDPGTYGCS